MRPWAHRGPAWRAAGCASAARIASGRPLHPQPRRAERGRDERNRGGCAVSRSQVVVVTGASSGIGRATALRFASEGASLVLAARRAQALAAVVAECEEAGGRAVAVPTDVTDEAAVDALAARAV